MSYSSTMSSGQLLLEVKRYEVQTKLCKTMLATAYLKQQIRNRKIYFISALMGTTRYVIR